MKRALSEFTLSQIHSALDLLRADHLTRSEKFVVPLEWLMCRHIECRDMTARAANHLLRRAIAEAPEGYCHPRAGVTGSLLEDMAAGMSFSDVKARWEAKMHPLRYQRPQAAPKAGTIAQAEKTFEAMGLARSLERRFARLDEIEVSWTPQQYLYNPARRYSDLFSHLAARRHDGLPLGLPSSTMTWAKFMDKILPAAEQLEVYCENHMMPFIGLTTAVHDDAPPILKWDRDDERNPFAWYLYHQGSHPNHWNLITGWRKVNAITQLPPMWGPNPQKHLGEGFVLIVDGCRDARQPGNALFPECLRGELHGVRSVIEADCRTRKLAGQASATANGLDIRAGDKAINYRLRVTRGGHTSEYRIDRWD